MAASLSARCSTAVRNELPIPLANCMLMACRTGSPSSAASVASCSLPKHDKDIVEARGADLSDRPAEERLAVERQEELLSPHPRRSACREHHCAHHTGVV